MSNVSTLIQTIALGSMLVVNPVAATDAGWNETATQAAIAFENALPNDKKGIKDCKAIVKKYSDGKAHTTIHDVNDYVKLMIFTGKGKGYGYGCIVYPVKPKKAEAKPKAQG
jgi:hypothetical protein